MVEDKKGTGPTSRTGSLFLVPIRRQEKKLLKRWLSFFGLARRQAWFRFWFVCLHRRWFL